MAGPGPHSPPCQPSMQRGVRGVSPRLKEKNTKMFNSRDISRKRVRMRDLIYKLQAEDQERDKKRRKTGSASGAGCDITRARI